MIRDGLAVVMETIAFVGLLAVVFVGLWLLAPDGAAWPR